MMKKFLSLVVAALLTVSAVATSASAAKFTDVDATNDALNDAVELLVALNVTTGTTDTTYGTTENVTRAQMATFIYRMMKAGKHAPTGGTNTTKFTDLDDPFYYFTIAWANETGVIKGRNETTFDPKGGIILQDAYTMIVRALGYDDGTLSYPIGYITKAEELDLDEDIDSKVNYDTTLTRGDVAILLSNMFYAETAEAHIQYVEETIGGKTVTKPQEFRYTLAEDVFGVKKLAQRVVATPNYAFGTNESPIDADVEMVKFSNETVHYADYNTSIPSLGEREFAELGLEGKADDYFLTDILMFVKENKSGEYEIFGATAQGTKKTVSFDDIEFGAVKGTGDEYYYDGAEQEHKFFNGLLTIDGVKTYLGDAPYSYTKDSENPDKYNPTFITLDAYPANDVEEDGAQFKYVDVPVDVSDEDAIIDLVQDDNARLGDLGYIYYGGLGEMDCIDSNGDGKYDYLFMKDYSVATIDTMEDADLQEVNNFESELYTDNAIVEGVTFADEDVVLAYVNKNANYVKVIEVIKPVKEAMTLKTDDYLEIESGKKIYFDALTYAIANNSMIPGDLKASDDFDTKSAWYFTADGALVAYGNVGAEQFNTDENWVIVLADSAEKNTALVDGVLETDYYLTVYNDGAIKSIKVKSISGDDIVANKTPTTVNGENNYYFGAYKDILATAKANKKGYYTFELLTGAQTGTTNYNTILKGSETGVDGEYKVIKADDVKFYQKSANLFILEDATHLTNDLAGVRVTANTKILLKTKDEDTGKDIITLYTADNLPDINESENLINVSYVLTNNKNSTAYEYIAMFYGEVEDGKLNGKDGDLAEVRIVKSVSTSKDADGVTVYTFTLYNPFTGAEETAEGVESMDGTDVAALTANSIVALTSDSKLVGIGKAGSVNITSAYAATAGAMYNKDGDKSFADIVAADPSSPDKLGLVDIAAFDKESGFLEITGKDPIAVTADTKITMLDISSKKISTISDAEVLNSDSPAYSFNGFSGADMKDADGTSTVDVDPDVIKAFICIEDGEEEEDLANALFIMIVKY